MPSKKIRNRTVPIKKITVNGVHFSIFLAKDFFQLSWLHPDLLKLVKEARKSYLKYGSVPLIDDYDAKSLVYLIKAEYEHDNKDKKAILVEWLCIRFTPAEGQPEAVEDFVLNVNGKGNLKLELAKKYGDGHFKNFVSMSRICRIPPKNSDKKICLDKNNHTFACFIIANHTFLEHRHKYGPFKYISGLFRPELLQKKFSIRLGNKILPRYMSAQKILKLGNKPGIKINRNFYIYSYPGYFLKLHDIYGCLKKLAEEKILRQKTINYYLGSTGLKNLEKFMALSKKLGKFLSTKGPLKYSDITGRQLRKIFNKEVGDGPELKIVPIKSWQKDINTLISSLNKIV